MSDYELAKTSNHVLLNNALITFKMFVHKEYIDCFFKLQSSSGWSFRSPKFDSISSLTNAFQIMLDTDFLTCSHSEAQIVLDFFEMIPKYQDILRHHLDRLGETMITFGTHEGKKLNELPAKYLLWFDEMVEAGHWENPDPRIVAYINANRGQLDKEILEEERIDHGSK